MIRSHGCAGWRDGIGTYVIGALEQDEHAAMSQHIAACPACRTEYEDLLPVRDWLARTKRHLTACLRCHTHYEKLLLPGLARYRA
ncbi:MAG: anti-sigma factor family protein [Trebonia sp.]